MKKHVLLAPLIFIQAVGLLRGQNPASRLHTAGIVFIQNKGQVVNSSHQQQPEILYTGTGGKATVYLQKKKLSFVYSLVEKTKAETESTSLKDISQHENVLIKSTRVDLQFEGSNPNPVIIEEQKTPDYFNYFLPQCPAGITNVHGFKKITYKEIYKNTDVSFYGGEGNGLKYDIIVNPGGDLKQIDLNYSGVQQMEIHQGRLSIKTELGEIEEYIPKIYQQINGRVIEINGGYILHDNHLSFNVKTYNKNFPLVIDPWVSFYGGSGTDFWPAIATDLNGDPVITFSCFSTDIPTTPGVVQTSYNNGDAVISKINANGTPTWTTYFGGSNSEISADVFTDKSGNVLMTGSTTSTDLPLSVSPYLPAFAGVQDVFAVKLNATGTSILFSTYVGGPDLEMPSSITTDNSDNVILSGYTRSSLFPTNTGPAYAGGPDDIFIFKMDPAGNFQWSRFAGGSNEEFSTDLTSDNSGNIYMIGYSNSTDWPTTAGAFQMTYGGGGDDAILLKMDASANSILSSYYGGTSIDNGSGVRIDNVGNIIFDGATLSLNFYSSAGSYQPAIAGTYDTFLIKADGNGIPIWGTFFGGTGIEETCGLAVDANDDIFIGGDTYSSDLPITSCAFQKTFGGKEDNYTAHFNSSGQLICATYVGGPDITDDEEGFSSLAISNSAIYLTSMASGMYPVTANAYKTVITGAGYDPVVASLCKFNCGDKAVLTPSITASATGCINAAQNFTGAFTSACPGSASYSWNFQGGTPSSSTTQNSIGITFASVGNHEITLYVNSGCGVDSVKKNISITSPAVTASASALTCSSTTSTLTASSASSTLVWNGGVLSNSANPATVSTSGIYTVTATDAGGCTNSTTVSVTFKTIPTLSASGNDLNCNNSSSTLTAVSLGNTMLWNGPSLVNANNPAVVASAATYTVTATDASSGCTKTATVTVVQQSSPSVSTSVLNNVKCNGGNNGSAIASLTGGTGPYTYNWSNSSTGPTANNLISGTFTVTVRDASNCQSTSTVVVTQAPSLNLPAFVNTNASCGQTNGTATATAVGGTGTLTYTWSNGASGQTISGVAAGGYSVLVTDANACTVSASSTIGNSSAPTIVNLATSDLTCNASGDGFITVNASGGSGTLTYSWSDGSSGATTINSLSAGTYTVSVVDAVGCKTTSTAIVNEPAQISTPLFTNIDAACGASNGSLLVNSSGGTGTLSYSWSNNTTGSTNNNLAAGNYTVTVSDSKGCSQTASALVNNLGGPVITGIFSTDPLCNGNTGSASITVSGVSTPFTYNWNMGSSGPTASGLISGTYTVTVSDSKSCQVISTVTITQPPPLILQPITVTNASCGQTDGTAMATATGGTGTLSYSWSNGTSGPTISAVAAGIYSVMISDANACVTSATATIGNTPSPTINSVTPLDLSCNASADGSISVNASGGIGALTYSWSTGTTGLTTINSLSAGTYTITVIDGLGCKAICTANITEPTKIATPVFIVTDAACGASNGALSVSSSGGIGALSYSWSNAITGTTNTNISAGNYSVTIYDSKGCSQTASALVNNIGGPVITGVFSADPKCNGGLGSANITASGGTAPFIYSWNAGSTGPTASNLIAATYTVTISDSKNCLVISTVSITEPSALAIQQLTPINASCGQTDGTATVTAIGGTGPLNYTWSNGAGGQTISGIAVGVYSVTITDANACTISTISTIGNSPSPTIINVTTFDLTCNTSGDGAISVTASGGTGVLTYSWSNGITGVTTINSLSAATYTISVVDALGCKAISTVNLTEPSKITTPVFTSINAACGASNGLVSANSSGGSGTLSYSWSNNVSGATNSNISAGNYNVTISDSKGCSQTASALVNNGGGPVITGVFSSDPQCNGGVGSANITATGGTAPFTYSWNSGSTGPTASNLIAATYTVTISDSKNCLVISTVSITQPPALAIQKLLTSNSNCGLSNGSATATATGGTGALTYSWNNNVSGPSNTNLASGNYVVTVFDANNCTQTAAASVGNSSGPIINSISGINPLCAGSTGSATVIAGGGMGAITYSWSNNATGITATNLGANTYTVTASDANNCNAVSTVTISAPATLTVPAITTFNAACGKNNGTAIALSSGGTGALTYSWSNNLTGPSNTNLIAGNYTVTVYDMNNCSQFTTAIISNNNGPVLNSVTTTNPNCSNGAGSAIANATGGTLPLTYLWSNGISSSTTTNLVAGIYTVTATDANNCSTVSTTTIVQPAPLLLSSSASNANCQDNTGSLTLIASGGTGVLTYNWYSSGQSGGSGIISSPVTLGNLAAGIYTLQVTDNNNCIFSTSDSVKAAATNSIVVSAAEQTIAEGNTVALTATGAVNYTWTPSNSLSCSYCSNPVASPSTTTTYTITTINSDGCTSSALLTITVKPACTGDESDLFIANIFSPNNDGVNDRLYVEGNGLANMYWAIYDRWGNVLFETFNQAQGWDGTTKGNPMETGIYVYYLKALCIKTNTEIKLKGNVSLVK